MGSICPPFFETLLIFAYTFAVYSHNEAVEECPVGSNPYPLLLTAAVSGALTCLLGWYDYLFRCDCSQRCMGRHLLAFFLLISSSVVLVWDVLMIGGCTRNYESIQSKVSHLLLYAVASIIGFNGFVRHGCHLMCKGQCCDRENHHPQEEHLLPL